MKTGKTFGYIGLAWVVIGLFFLVGIPQIVNHEADPLDEKISFAHSNHIPNVEAKLSFIMHENEQHLEIRYFVSFFEKKPSFISFIIPYEGELVTNKAGWQSQNFNSGSTVLFKNFSCTNESCPNDDGYLFFYFDNYIDSFRLPNRYIQIPFSPTPSNEEIDKFIRELDLVGNTFSYGWNDVDTEVNVIFDNIFDEWQTQPVSDITSYIRPSGRTNIILNWDLEKDNSLFTAKYSRDYDRALADIRLTFIGVGLGAGISMLAAGFAINQSDRNQRRLQNFIETQRFVQDANTAYSLKEYASAKNYYDLAIKKDPNNLDTILLAGNAFYEMKRYDDAIPYYEKILQINPNHIGALNNYGACKAGLGDIEEAYKYYIKALDLNPNHIDAINNMGSLVLDEDLPEVALPFFEEVIASEKESPQVLTNKGKALTSLKKFPEAIECLDRALEIDRKFTDASLAKGKALYDQKDFKNAILCYDRILKLEPSKYECLFNLSLCYLQLEEHDNAIKFAREFLSTKSFHIDTLNTLGIALAKKDDHEEAIKNYNLILDKEKDNKEALYNKALSLMLSNRSDLAIPLFDAVLKQDPKNMGTIINKGNCFMNLNKIPEAIVEFDKALSIEPLNTDALMLKRKAEDKLNES